MKKWPWIVAATAGPLFAHVAPAGTWLAGPTIRLWPRLKGIGRPGHVALTFDDGPDPVSTPVILDELDELGWSATFFVLGEMARRAPGLIREIVDRGHELGLHGDRHHSHLLMTPRAVRRDLTAGVETVTELTGRRPSWFRPPYGHLSLGSLVAARQLALEPVLWSTWGKDWRADATPRSVTSTVLASLGPGGTILLHDSDCTSTPGSWRTTLTALPLLASDLGGDVEVGPLRDHFRPTNAHLNPRMKIVTSRGSE